MNGPKVPGARQQGRLANSDEPFFRKFISSLAGPAAVTAIITRLFGLPTIRLFRG